MVKRIFALIVLATLLLSIDSLCMIGQTRFVCKPSVTNVALELFYLKMDYPYMFYQAFLVAKRNVAFNALEVFFFTVHPGAWK